MRLCVLICRTGSCGTGLKSTFGTAAVVGINSSRLGAQLQLSQSLLLAVVLRMIVHLCPVVLLPHLHRTSSQEIIASMTQVFGRPLRPSKICKMTRTGLPTSPGYMELFHHGDIQFVLALSNSFGIFPLMQQASRQIRQSTVATTQTQGVGR